MNIKTTLSLLAALSLLSGCSTMKVTSKHDPDFDFGKIQTYQWIDGPADILGKADTVINEDVQQALDAELAQRGFQSLADSAEVDVQVAHYVKLKEEREYTSSETQDSRDFSGGFVYRRESKSWSYDEREPDLNIYAIEVGTLTVLVYDAKSGKRIWKGTLKTEIDRSQPKNNQQTLIRTAVEKLMKRFPAK